MRLFVFTIKNNKLKNFLYQKTLFSAYEKLNNNLTDITKGRAAPWIKSSIWLVTS
jgi:hypothetical protein